MTVPSRHSPLFDTTGRDPSWLHAMDYLRTLFNAHIVFDMDSTIYCGGNADQLRWGVRPLFADLHEAGNSVHIWSRSSGVIAAEMAARHSLDSFVTSTHNKPPFGDNTLRAAKAILDFTPDITVDDLLDEKVEGIPMLHVAPFHPNPARNHTLPVDAGPSGLYLPDITLVP